MNKIKEIYDDTRTDIDFEEFEQRVQEKDVQMGDLVDTEAAAMLIAQEVGDTSISKIEDIEKDDDSANFTAKITGIGDITYFDRDNDDSDDDEDNTETESTDSEDADTSTEDDSEDDTDDDADQGRVINITVADETDSIKATFWNSKAERIVDEYSVGDTVAIEGTPKDGYSGVEVNVNSIELAPDEDVDIDLKDAKSIGDLTEHHEMVTISGKILGTSSINEFDTNGGGQVSNVVIGDATGDVTLTLWNDAAEIVNEVGQDDEIHVKNADVRVDEDTESLELHLSQPDSITEIDEDISYRPDSDLIEALEEGDYATIHGIVTYVSEVDEYEGSNVQNIEIEDDSDSIRASLWRDRVRPNLSSGTEIVIKNAEIEEGWQDGLEASLFYKSTLYLINEPRNIEEESAPSSIDSFNESEGSISDDEAGKDAESDGAAAENNEDAEDSDSVEVNGTVLKTGDNIHVDTANGKVEVDPTPDSNVRLGESITIRGTKTDDGVIDAEEMF